ncbi:glycoside hydrolase family 95 protein [Paenibacillus ferrarius]|uniref:glycoside hydrolase family 95 protein n=1 Tax=Paenibacillus ferrarius TaxID=1469647 RepID=UPI003D27D7E4
MSANQMVLWYGKPAAEWVEALAVGNGRLGGMVYGGAMQERIQLNEDTLWSGQPINPKDPNEKGGAEYLEEVRRLVFAGNYPEAQDIIEKHMLGQWSESYQSMGELRLEMEGNFEIADFRRELDLRDAVCRTSFTVNGARYLREVFVSAVDQVMVVRITADSPSKVTLLASLDSPLNHGIHKGDRDRIVMNGQAPSHVEPFHVKSENPVIYEEDKGIRFEAQLLALPEGGSVEVHGNRLWVRRADAVTFLLAAATSFNGFDKDPVRNGKDPAVLCRAWLSQAAGYSYEELLSRHQKDYRELFARVEFELTAPGRPELPTNERILALREGGTDEQLAVLFFHFGRYLLISSSRPGTQPATLQGIWNDRLRPPWSCNYTVNINTQMNYWPAEVCNLAECHTPLFDLLQEISISGKETASAYYRAGGWVCHSGVDLWRRTSPAGGLATWAFWPMAGPWLCTHLWEHHRFGGDRTFLEGIAYPIMKEAAVFLLDWLVEDAEGYLVTNPSTSPENTFIGPDGRLAAVSMATTMDNALIREHFSHCIEASALLETDSDFRGALASARDRLRPLRTGRYGQLLEWYEDFTEAEPGHRHVAHLYGLHPGYQIDNYTDSALADACRISLQRRLEYEKEDAVGWCFAWLINLFARLEDSDMAHRYLVKLLRNPFPNLFNAHRHPRITFYPLTIEANFGATAGIAELLLQSHTGELRLLPALPAEWPEGRISGLRARGGFTVYLEWSKGRLSRAVIESISGHTCRIRAREPVQVAEGLINAVPTDAASIEFPTQAGQKYTILPLSSGM